jgi:hypothetical protein
VKTFALSCCTVLVLALAAAPAAAAPAAAAPAAPAAVGPSTAGQTAAAMSQDSLANLSDEDFANSLGGITPAYGCDTCPTAYGQCGMHCMHVSRGCTIDNFICNEADPCHSTCTCECDF